jgi:glycosyltransferase involved in cell wall biosynthesis
MITLILAAYDRPELLERELKQIIAQTYKDWEVLMLDEASDERNKQVVDNLGDERIKYKKVERVGDWGYKVKAEAVKDAQGEYLCFGSDDNEYDPTFFEKMKEPLDKGADMVICDFNDDRFPAGWVFATPWVGGCDLGTFMMKTSMFTDWGPIHSCTDGEYVRGFTGKRVELHERLYTHH